MQRPMAVALGALVTLGAFAWPSAAPAAEVLASAAVRACSVVCLSVDESGSGKAAYWMRTCLDYAAEGRQAAAALRQLAAGSSSRPLAVSLEMIAGPLAALEASGDGNADYWMARVTGQAAALRAAGAQLKGLAEQLDQGTFGRPQPAVSLRSALQALALVGRSFDCSGTGNVDYWCRACEDAVVVARSVGGAVRVLAVAAPEDVVTTLQMIATPLERLSAPTQSGNVDFWMATAQGLGQRITAQAANLEQLASKY